MERLRGPDKYFCEMCDRLRDADKTVELSGLPQMMTLHFHHQPENRSSRDRSMLVNDVIVAPGTDRVFCLNACIFHVGDCARYVQRAALFGGSSPAVC